MLIRWLFISVIQNLENSNCNEIDLNRYIDNESHLIFFLSFFLCEKEEGSYVCEEGRRLLKIPKRKLSLHLQSET